MIKNEQITTETQKAIDTAMELVTTSIHSVEKLTHIQLETSRQIMEETSKAIKELAGVTDPKEMFSRVNAMATQAVEKNLASARDVYDIVSEVQSKINKVAEESVQNLQQAALTSVDGLSQYNPTGAKAATDSLKTWINSANQALSAMNKVAAQVTEFTNSNINAATTATVNAAKKTTKK
ncbi:MAG: phasin family protein [Neisseriales bacterium]|jgi:phasin family protein|nr:MAG: phasin family protein [Neisseriales bacterium]HRG61531.1 phasin family protein [Burkholderiales bacterium]